MATARPASRSAASTPRASALGFLKSLGESPPVLNLYKQMCNKAKRPPVRSVLTWYWASSLKREQVQVCLDDLEPVDQHVLASFLAKATAFGRVQLWTKSAKSIAADSDMSYGKADPLHHTSPTPSKWDRLQGGKTIQTPRGRASESVGCNALETLRLAKGMEVHFKSSGKLQELKLVGLRFSVEAWKYLSRGMTNAPVLQYVGLISCDLSDPILADVSTSLISIKTLRKLDLSRNSLGKESGFQLARVISQHGERRDEVLWAHGLRNELPQVVSSEGLEQLCFAYNQIPDQGVEEIARVIRSDVWVKVLDLRHNEISETGVGLLSEAMRMNKALLFLDVRDNNSPVDHNSHRLIYNRLRRNVIRHRKRVPNDVNQWEERLLEIAVSIDPQVMKPEVYVTETEPEEFDFAQEFKAVLEEQEQDSEPQNSPELSSQPDNLDSSHLCGSCRSLETKLLNAERTIAGLQLENSQLRKQLLHPSHFSSPSISQHTLTAGESMSVTGASQKPVQSGTGEELDSGTLLKIEQMMSELTRLMDGLETSGHRTGNST